MTRRLTGLEPTDVHNGLRAFNRKIASRLDFSHKDMAHASNAYSLIARHRFSYVEVDTAVLYTSHSMGKGQSLLNSLNILFDLLVHGHRHD